jgi:hypothetical protein
MASKDIALPLPADVDVSDMQFMPLFDVRLTKSRAWLRARHWRGHGPGLGFILMNLWVAAFRNVPAGSLEEDDDLLADAARVDIEIWRQMREQAMEGWQLIAGRWWHPVLAEIAWDLWKARLAARHEKAHDRYRLACRRAADKGLEPPLPIGSFLEWLAVEFPGSHAYMNADLSGDVLRLSGDILHLSGDKSILSPDKPEKFADRLLQSDVCPPQNAKNPADIVLKGRKGKDIPPLIPPNPQAGRVVPGKEEGSGASDAVARKRWFAETRGSLYREFGQELASTCAMYLQRPRRGGRGPVSGDFGLVETFKGSWLEMAPGGVRVIVMPSKQRADATWAAHHEWLAAIQPPVRLRHATVAEKRTMGAVR